MEITIGDIAGFKTSAAMHVLFLYSSLSLDFDWTSEVKKNS